jgi:hypothetical protein
MLLKEPLAFAVEFIRSVNKHIESEQSSKKISKLQCYWLAFCISAIIITNSVCWARFEKISIGKCKLSSLSWMFRRGKICWERLLFAGIKVILEKYEITKGVLVLDDSDRPRSKNTTHLAHVHKQKDKKTNGYVMGQNLVFLLLVTPKVTIPVGFSFYQPDPTKKAWRIEDTRLKKLGVKKKNRPAEPDKNPDYPTKRELGLALLREFKQSFELLNIQCILADAFYSDGAFMDEASSIFNGVQVISQIRHNQITKQQSKEKTIRAYFNAYPGITKALPIRFGECQSVILGGARLWVKAHQKRRYVIALRYEGEQEDRYIVATNMTWMMTDIASAYTMRWLVEVFFSDWKQYEGWCQMAKQPGVDGSNRGLILSLLTDYALLLHPEQTALLKHKLPALTVGSLRDHIRFEAIILFIKQIIDCDDPAAALTKCSEQIKRAVPLVSSRKHLNHRAIGRLGPSVSLKYRSAA